jgi:flagellar biosynthetic protein FliP
LTSVFIPSSSYAQNIPVPSVNFGFQRAENPQQVSLSLQILLLITILSVAPAIVMMTTCFVRISIVFMFTRTALATQQMPPNQVLMGLALFLTFFIMAPTFKKIYNDAWKPYTTQTAAKKMTFEQMYTKAMKPLREFMFKQLDRPGDNAGLRSLAFFQNLAKLKRPKTPDDVPSYVLIPSFMIHELKRSFEMGIKIFIPFIIIDLIVASILMSMGMIMLPPVMVSLPFKIILFVLVNGWDTIVVQLVKSFN